MGWMTPHGIDVPKLGCNNANGRERVVRRAIDERGYNDRSGFGQEPVSGAWGRARGSGAHSCWRSLPSSRDACWGWRPAPLPHYWARELREFGHEARLIAPAYAKAYVRRELERRGGRGRAIREAVSRPSIRFVAIKTERQQATAGIHRVRELLMKQHTIAAQPAVRHDGGVWGGGGPGPARSE